MLEESDGAKEADTGICAEFLLLLPSPPEQHVPDSLMKRKKRILTPPSLIL